MRKLLLILPILLPAPLKRSWYRNVLGFTIGRRVRIGLCFLDARTVTIGDDVRIGHFNLFRNLKQFAIGDGTYISNFNTFSGNTYTAPGWDAAVVIGSRCSIMSHHFFDAAGTITIGPGTTLAGRDTQLWTHTVASADGQRKLVPRDLTLGADCYIGARCTFLFCSIPDGAFVGAGSVVTKSFAAADGPVLIAGNPAKVRKVYARVP